MKKICVFAGTTEGRKLVEFLSGQDCFVTACVATDYGRTLIEPAEKLTILEKRLDCDAMAEMFQQENYDLVVDATHPYAAIVTDNINKACGQTKTEYMRLLREESDAVDGAVYVPDALGAVEYLNEHEGNILLTTGSKELHLYTGIHDFAERVYPRVLPMQASLTACENAGVKVSHIIAVQGPFTEEMNIAQLHAIQAAYLVTKDGGSTGGFDDKADAAKKAGARLIVIGRPPQLEGYSFSEVVKMFEERYGFRRKQKVTVVGIGPGNAAAMTKEVTEAIETAECLIGAKRMIEAVRHTGQAVCEAVASAKIAEYINEHKEFSEFTVVMSGDSGFFSGTKKLLPLLGECEVKVLPGLSSLSYFCARLGLSYENVKMTSVHGRQHNIVPDVRENGLVFVLTGGEEDIHAMCRALSAAGLGEVRIHIAERLSYPEERILSGTPEELLKESFDKLSVVLVENPNADKYVSAGFPDSAFTRGGGEKGVVPMTKSEVRAVCLSKLALTEHAVCWDVGAGTGSVSIEMALLARKGMVYAIEKNEDAVSLLETNKEKFMAENLEIIPGLAPDACADLPAPTHVFIGGSSGNVRPIIELARGKNPDVRIVATAITLESIAELTECLKDFGTDSSEVVAVNAASGKKAGRYHLMMAQNPVYVFAI